MATVTMQFRILLRFVNMKNKSLNDFGGAISLSRPSFHETDFLMVEQRHPVYIELDLLEARL